MKITKYPQSCVFIEAQNKKILIDPGTLMFEESFLEKWKDVDVILVSHRHKDHCDDEIIKKLGVKIYTIKEVEDTFSLNAEIVKEGAIIDLDDVKIEVVKSVHGDLPYFTGDKEINENVGFIIEDSENRAYFVGDSICFKNNYKCDVLIIPVCNHGLAMGPFEASLFAKQVEAKLVIPVHYDHPKHPVDKKEVEREFEKQDLKYKFLDIGESVEV